MIRRMAFIADDFGRSASTNEAILDGHIHGALDGASLMLGQPGTGHAIELARSHPGLAVGWHIHVCDSIPMTTRSWPWNRSPLAAGLCLAIFGRRIRAELRAQWQCLMASGLHCSFINSHHHLHAHPAILGIIRSLLPRSFDGWLRGFNIRPFARHLPLHAKVLRFAGTRSLAGSGLPLRRSDTTWGLDRLFSMSAHEIEAVLPHLGSGLHEFIFHPRGGAADADAAALRALARGSHNG